MILHGWIYYRAADVIPPKNAIESALDEEEVEEIIKQERSLLYVASTRAREKLYILSYGTPSRLLPGNGSHS